MRVVYSIWHRFCHSQLFLYDIEQLINDVHGNNILKTEYSLLISVRKVSILMAIFCVNVFGDIRNALIPFGTQIARHLFHSFVIYLLFCTTHTQTLLHSNVQLLLSAFSLIKVSVHPQHSNNHKQPNKTFEKLCRNCVWIVRLDNDKRTNIQVNAPKIFTSGNLISKIDAILWFCWHFLIAMSPMVVSSCSRQHDNIVCKMKSSVLLHCLRHFGSAYLCVYFLSLKWPKYEMKLRIYIWDWNEEWRTIITKMTNGLRY